MAPLRRVQVAMLLYILVFSFFCIRRYTTAYLGDPDYGLFNQSFWTATQMDWLFYNTFENGTHFRTHNSPILFLIFPFYSIVPSICTLLVVQVVAVAFGALAVFRLATLFLDEDNSATLALLFLVYHPVHGVTYDQFNELGFLFVPLFCAFHSLYRRRMGRFWFCALLALSCKEDVSFVTAMLGVYVAFLGVVNWRRSGRADPLIWHGLALTLVSAAWLCFSLFILFPTLRGGQDWPYFKDRYGEFGNNFHEVMVTLITRPSITLSHLFSKQAILVFFELVTPLAFLPLRAPRVLAIVAPTWGVLQLSSFGAMHNTGSRYMAPIVVCIFVATILALRERLGPPARPEISPLSARNAEDVAATRRSLRWPIVLTILFSLAFNSTPLRFPFTKYPRLTPHQRAAFTLLDRIGPDDSVSTQAEFFGHVSGRLNAFMGWHGPTRYILVDPTEDLWYKSSHWHWNLPPLLKAGRYHVEAEADGAILYKIK